MSSTVSNWQTPLPLISTDVLYGWPHSVNLNFHTLKVVATWRGSRIDFVIVRSHSDHINGNWSAWQFNLHFIRTQCGWFFRVIFMVILKIEVFIVIRFLEKFRRYINLLDSIIGSKSTIKTPNCTLKIDFTLQLHSMCI